MTSGPPCYFCGQVHGDECPEFTLSGEKVVDVDAERDLRCSRCGEALKASVLVAVDLGWLVDTREGVVVGSTCATCSRPAREKLEQDVREWRRRGEPRGDN